MISQLGGDFASLSPQNDLYLKILLVRLVFQKQQGKLNATVGMYTQMD